jgi:Protein of unknown function (DUF1376)
MTSPECDCTDLDSFLLNVERLMASELVALSSHEVIGAALLLWCRAWKQVPAASLPDDDNVNAAFAKMRLSRFKKLKNEIMRGFAKCSDGRLYHRTLAAVSMESYEKKIKFREKNEKDSNRQRVWRARKKQLDEWLAKSNPIQEQHDKQNDRADVTRDETCNVTRNVTCDVTHEKRSIREGKVREYSDTNVSGDKSPSALPSNQKPELYRRGKEVLGEKAAGLITNLLKAKHDNIAQALDVIERASEAENAREYIGRVIAGKPPPVSFRDAAGNILGPDEMMPLQRQAWQDARNRGDIG